MSTASLIPQAFWFRLAIPCLRVDGLPKPGGKGRLLDLPESCRVVPTVELEGKTPWSECRVAWNSTGLALQFEVRGKVGPIQFDPYIPDLSDGVQFWIDTRDTRDIHRASRFCHRYSVILFLTRARSHSVSDSSKSQFIEPRPTLRKRNRGRFMPGLRSSVTAGVWNYFLAPKP